MVFPVMLIRKLLLPRNLTMQVKVLLGPCFRGSSRDVKQRFQKQRNQTPRGGSEGPQVIAVRSATQ